ncbi:peptidyl-prolyl cis-trans isomerase [candidate division KSB1 bacterium]
MKNLIRISLYISIVLLSLTACKERDDSVVLARVGDNVLTEADLFNRLNVSSLKGINYRHLLEIVNRWVDMEILYLEAVETGLRKEPEIEKTIEDEMAKIERNLLIDKYFEININSKLEFSNDELELYYENNKEEFEISENRYYISHISTPNRESSIKLREAIRKSINFDRISLQDIPDCQVFNYKPKFVGLSDVDTEIGNRISRLRTGQNTDFRVNNVYHFIRLNSIKRSGDYHDFDDVKDRIKLILTVNKRKELENSLLANLRNKDKYQINFNILREISKVDEKQQEGNN